MRFTNPLRIPLRRSIAAVVCLSYATLATGCATMIHGTHQKLNAAGRPDGSTVTVYKWDGEVVAGPTVTPSQIKIRRPKWGHPYLAVATNDGYCPHYWVPKTSMTVGGWIDSIWALATLGLAAVVTLIIDSGTGAAFQLDQKDFNAVSLERPPCEI